MTAHFVLGVVASLALTLVPNDSAHGLVGGRGEADRCAAESDLGQPLVLPEPDPALQQGLDRVLAASRFNGLVSRNRLSVALVDLTEPCHLRYAGTHDDQMRYAASLPKIAVLLAVFDEIDRGTLRYTTRLRQQLESMIRRSSNSDANALIRLVGFEVIARVLRDPRYLLYNDDQHGGLWLGRDYGGVLGRWKQYPLRSLWHGATARQAARFFVMLKRERLVSAWASGEMKDILGNPEIDVSFVKGLASRPASRVYRKSGTWQGWYSDAALVERDGIAYVAVGLLETTRGANILSDLILHLDDVMVGESVRRHAVGQTTH